MAEETGRILQRTLLGEAVEAAAGAAVFVWNEDRRYHAVNDEACRLVGLGREALIGMPVGDLLGDGAAELIADVSEAPFRHGRLALTRPGGEVVELEWVTTRTRVAGLPCFVSVCWQADAG